MKFNFLPLALLASITTAKDFLAVDTGDGKLERLGDFTGVTAESHLGYGPDVTPVEVKKDGKWVSSLDGSKWFQARSDKLYLGSKENRQEFDSVARENMYSCKTGNNFYVSSKNVCACKPIRLVIDSDSKEEEEDEECESDDDESSSSSTVDYYLKALLPDGTSHRLASVDLELGGPWVLSYDKDRTPPQEPQVFKVNQQNPIFSNDNSKLLQSYFNFLAFGPTENKDKAMTFDKVEGLKAFSCESYGSRLLIFVNEFDHLNCQSVELAFEKVM